MQIGVETRVLHHILAYYVYAIPTCGEELQFKICSLLRRVIKAVFILLLVEE